MKQIALAAVFLCMFMIPQAQNYQAIHGSPYAGSLGIYNNPATGVHSHYNWDVTLLSTQIKSSTNAFSSTKPILSLPQASVYLSNGNTSRYEHTNQDVHLLNTRFKINRRSAIAFGLNGRSYVHAKAKDFKFIDTISSFNSFLQLNRPVPSIQGRAIENSWAELYASYSRIIRSTSTDQLSAGITLKGIRGASGLYVQIDQFSFDEFIEPGSLPTYFLKDAAGKYGYSSNYDKLEDNSGDNVKEFLQYTQGSVGIDLGVEYLLKADYPPQFDDDQDELGYNWKIGVSVLDLGRNYFKHGRYSRTFSGAASTVSEVELEEKFSGIEDIQDMYDSLQTVVTTLRENGPDFYIWQPTRLVINIDKPIVEDFYINGELTINFFSTQNKNQHHTRELNFLTVTPRWETSFFGAYLPVQFNTEGQLWIGTALKAGPLLIGVHDWGAIFNKNKIFNGGAYLALTVRNFFSPSTKAKRIKYMDCPPF